MPQFIFPRRLLKLLLSTTTIICIAINVSAQPPAADPETVGMSAQRLALISDMSEAFVASGKVPGLITMVNRGGKIVHFEATGQRGIKDTRPLEKDALFRIYSMSKPITAVAAMQLYEQGKFKMSDPISKFVPELSSLKVLNEDGELEPVETEITMHHLLTHTAGFSYGFVPDDPVDKLYREAGLWGAKDLTAFAVQLAELPLRYQPGTRWHYSVAVDVTGLVIERISGMSFDKYLDENLLQPLGMHDTFFEVPADKLDRLLPSQYWDYKERKSKLVADNIEALGVNRANDALLNFADVSLYSGGAGLVSSTMDYMRFAEMLRNGGSANGVRILSPKTLKFMTRNHLPATTNASSSGEQPMSEGSGSGFGLGFGVTTDPIAMKTIGSVGEFMWGGAAGTVFWVDPVEDLVVIGMIQLMGSPWSLRHDLRVRTYQSLTESYE